MMNRQKRARATRKSSKAVSLIAAITASLTAASIFIPAAYEWRGYVAYGGEWIIIGAVAAITYGIVESYIEKR